MKRFWMTIMVVLAVSFFASTSQAYSVKMYDASGDNYKIDGLTGGPFTANVLSPVPSGMVGTPITGGLGLEFLTFCLETNEYFNYGALYSFTLDTYAVNGGAGGATAGQDPLDPRTAYLYYNFRMNESLYDNDHRMALQAAFWHIENEKALPTSNPTIIQQYAWNYVNNAGGWADIGPVKVMNLYDSAGVYKQSQLTLVPEPTTLLLLGLGLVGLGLSSRRLKK